MSAPHHPDLDARRRRLLFRATHRGTHENDLLVGGFVSAGVAGFTEPELAALEAILELPDVALSDWLTGRAPIPPEADSPMLRRMAAAAARAAARAPAGPHDVASASPEPRRGPGPGRAGGGAAA